MFSKRFARLTTSPENRDFCGSRPNCVCSLCPVSDDQHWIEPLQGIGGQPIAAISEVVGNWDRTKIIEQTDDFLLVEFRSRLGFVDDVEFLLAGDIVHVRSASRVGYGDHGVNRDRIESVRQTIQNMVMNDTHSPSGQE